MERHLDIELIELKSKIVAMAGFCERAVEEATIALTRNDESRIKKVLEFEKYINLAHIEIDQGCLELLARQSPLATDLRWILAIIKINTDLERMGDQAVNIAYNTEDYLKQRPLKIVSEIERMSIEVQSMIRQSLDAFVDKNETLARKVLKKDDEVDAYKNKIFQELKKAMHEDTSVVDPALDLILIARNLERLGDHATNIAEDVIFVATGEDIRHGGKK